MTGFKIVNLLKLIKVIGENEVKDILSNFLCPHNPDVEKYLKTKAIDFARQGWAQTHLVYASYKKEMVLVGYFALADKYIHIFPDKKMSNTLRKRIGHFSQYDKDLNCYCMTAPLIGQLGKNYNNGYNKLISGDELLKIACDKIQSIQVDLGGKFTYLECEDKPFLIDFYERNGFYNFGKRNLDRDEKNDFETSYLIQLLKYLK
ncbi:MAG: N-acetyltransferase [Butyricicoccus pullicaecorum]|nr:N-acetyltransferase [Butyricicoccus pullicaecorum]